MAPYLVHICNHECFPENLPPGMPDVPSLHSKEVMLFSKHTLACRQYTRTCFFLKDGQRSYRHHGSHLLTPRLKRCTFEAPDSLKRRKPHNTQGEIFSSISREHKDQITMALSRLKLPRAHLLGLPGPSAVVSLILSSDLTDRGA